MNIFSKQQNRGFTLIEAMVAISILSLAITGPLLIAQKSIGSAVYARDQITASYLAQEALEYVRNVRDSNRISATDPWLKQFDGCKVTGGSPLNKCIIDASYLNFNNNAAIKPYDSIAHDRLCLYSDGSPNTVYGYCQGDTWKKTIFRRTVTVDETAHPGKEARISVTVSWSTNLFSLGGNEPSFTIEEYLFNY